MITTNNHISLFYRSSLEKDIIHLYSTAFPSDSHATRSISCYISRSYSDEACSVSGVSISTTIGRIVPAGYFAGTMSGPYTCVWHFDSASEYLVSASDPFIHSN